MAEVSVSSSKTLD